MSFSPLMMLPTLFGCLGHIGFCFLLLDKWESLELANDGEPILFANATTVCAKPDTGPPWWLVFLPPWVAEAGTAVVISIALMSSMGTFSTSWRLLQYTSLTNAAAGAGFKVMLMLRLSAGHGSWLITFAPIYLGMFAQAFLHYRKPPDPRGRRPGSPLSALGLLGLVVSFKLEGVLNYETSPWATVLWPLWGIGGFCGASLLLGVCCGVPLLLRREMQSQIACSLLALLLLLLAVFLPCLLASVRLTLWLDGDEHTTASMILVPWIISVVLMFFGLCILLVLLSVASRLRRLHPGGEENEEDEGAVAQLLAQFKAPKVLVRESATLFRRVTAGASPGDDALLEPEGNETLSDQGVAAMEEGCLPEAAPGARGAGLSASSVDVELMSIPDARGSAATPRSGAREGGPEPDVEHGGAPRGGGGEGQDAGGEDESAAGAAGAEGGHESGPLLEGSGAGDGGPLAARLDSDDGEEPTCWICCSGPCDAVLMECGHGGICMNCASQCWKKKPPLCPLCRARIIMVVQVGAPDEQGLVQVSER